MPGFVEWSTMYARYRVLATKIKAQFWVSSTYTRPLNVGIYMSPVALPGVTQADFQRLVRGNPNGRTNELIPGYRTTTVKMYRGMGKLSGDPVSYRTDQDYTAPINANPAKIFYGYVFASGVKMGEFPPAGVVYIKTEVTCYIRFYERDNELS